MTSRSEHIAVVGAGVVGTSCALWLQHAGFRVTLLDGNEPGSVTSAGNACTIADYGCIPVNSPSLFKRLPSLMFSRNSPLTISPGYALTHLPWLFSFLACCRRDRVNQTISALGGLLKHTDDGLDPLIKMTRTHDLFHANGCMYVYETEKSFFDARDSNQARIDQGVTYKELSAGEIRELEPAIKKPFQRGLLFENARHVLDPKVLVHRFVDYFQSNGGQYLQSHVRAVAETENAMRLQLDSGDALDCHKGIICCGAFSKTIAGSGLDSVPLDTERGYHVQYSDLAHLVNRPVAWAESGFYATPMNQGLRFAGTVEIAGLSNRTNARNLEFLSRKSREMFELDRNPDTTWLGFRPTLPDSLPVIGFGESERLLYAFGHQHIGLTLAGITGKVISELAAGQSPSVDLSAFRFDRFRE